MALRFDGQVAIVTGAGAGLGRIYARHLASRGAKVVVNDLGKDKDTGVFVAEQVVAEIKKEGGEAVASTDNAVDGEKLVKTALDAFGRLDILVANAGILRDVGFARMTKEQFDIVLQVHVYGTKNLVAAAWETMRKQKYGRIVLITSVNGLHGQRGQVNYSTAKAGLVGMAKALAKEGKKENIMVNAVAPGAGSAMTKTVMPENLVNAWKADYVAPMIGLLTHEKCPATGRVFEAGGGFFAEVKWRRAAGWYANIDKPFGPEDLLAQWNEITQFGDGATWPEEADAEGTPAQLKQIVSKL